MNAEDEKRVKELIEQYGAILQSKVIGADEALARKIATLERRIADLENRKPIQVQVNNTVTRP